MIPKCALLFVTFVAMYSCQSGKTELKCFLREKINLPARFIEYPSTVIMENSIRMNAVRHALSSLPQMDSIFLTPIYYPLPGTNGKFSMLPIRRGEQYNIMLPGGDRIFANAASKLYINFQPARKNYVVQGKVWIKAERDSAYIKTGPFKILLLPGGQINIDNYPNDSNIVISLINGLAIIMHPDHPIPLFANEEINIDRASGKTKIKKVSVDVTSWTVGVFRHWGVGLNYVINDMGRLYDKNVFTGEIDARAPALNFNYRDSTIDQVIKLYNRTLSSVQLELSGDSLKVLDHIQDKKEKRSS
jgi:hypothetical protein